MQRIRTILFLLLTLMFAILASAADKTTVTGRYTYFLPSDESEKAGRAYAIEMARLQALAENFGTYLSSTVTDSYSVSDKGERMDFTSFSTSDIAGVWLKTMDEKTEVSVEGNSIVIRAFVKGEARARDVSTAEFVATIGRVDDNGNFIPSKDFSDHERFDISFVCPRSGYLAIYSSDGVNNANRLLPLPNSPFADPIRVEGRREYRFFEDVSPKMTLEPEETSALLRLTFLFLPEGSSGSFVLPVDKSRVSPQGDILGWDVGNNQYQQWLGKLMNNPSLQRRDLIVHIKQ